MTAASQVAANFVGAVVSVGANQSLLRPTTIVEEDENVNEVASSSSSSSGASSGQLPRPVSSHVRTDTGDAGADADGEEDGEESDAFEAASAEERSQHAMRLKTHLAIVKEWACKAAAAGLKVKWSNTQMCACVIFCGCATAVGNSPTSYRLQHVYECVYRNRTLAE